MELLAGLFPPLEDVILMVCTCAILIGFIIAIDISRPVSTIPNPEFFQGQPEATSLWPRMLLHSAVGVVAGMLALLLPVVPGLAQRALAVVASAGINSALLIVVRLFELHPVHHPGLSVFRTIICLAAVSDILAVLCAQDTSTFKGT